MKKILLAVSVIALLAAGCNSKNADENVTSPEITVDANGVAKSADIVYFNIDSLVSKYDMYLDLRSAYEEKAKKAQNEITSKARSLERDVVAYTEKAQKGLLTTSQMQQQETALRQRDQQLAESQNTILGELGEEEQVMLNNIHYSIVEFLKEYNKDQRYGMILSSTAAGGPVMNADPKLDVTREVLEGLNKKYAAEQAAAK